MVSGPRAPGAGDGDIPRWKVAVAAAVLVVLGMTIAGISLWRARPPVTDGVHMVTAATSHRPAPAPQGEGERQRAGGRGPQEDAAVIAGVRSALDGWQRFARSADLADVEQAFVVGGPQHRQFRTEILDGRAGVDRVPEMTLHSIVTLRGTGQQREVTGQVALRGGERTEMRQWRFVLQRTGGRWRVWTVFDQS